MENKRFDCVQMKWEIQQQIQKEFSQIPGAQARETQMRQVLDDPILGSFCRDLMARKDSVAR